MKKESLPVNWFIFILVSLIYFNIYILTLLNAIFLLFFIILSCCYNFFFVFKTNKIYFKNATIYNMLFIGLGFHSHLEFRIYLYLFVILFNWPVIVFLFYLLLSSHL